MKLNKLLLAAVALLILWSVPCTAQKTNNQEDPRFTPMVDEIILEHEFRGAWVTTVGATDWPKNQVILEKISPKESKRAMRKRIARQIDSQKTAIVEMFTALKNCGINAVMFHTVSNSDAMYPSKILPWCVHLTGKQGGNPGYDPLAFAIETAHNLDLEIHAWLNPFRIGFKDVERAADHPCFLYPERVQTVETKRGASMYWNPAHPDVVDYLGDLCTELMTNYNLDGIHIDDYFYPDGLRGGGVPDWDDAKFYEEYVKGGGDMTLERWREENVNKVIRVMYDAVHKANPDAIFSVSPGGRLVNTQSLYADPQYWIAEGTIDFLAPQLYWQHGHPIADFKQVLDSWKDIMKDIPCVPGLAAYRWGEKGAFENLEEYDLQVQECREAKDYVYGNIWFTTKSILRPEFAEHMKTTFYKYPSLTPNFRADRTPQTVKAPKLRTRSDGMVSWLSDRNIDKYALYELEAVSTTRERKSAASKTVWRANLVQIFHTYDQAQVYRDSESVGYRNTGFFYGGTPGKNYVVIAIKGKDYSPLSNVVYVEPEK